MRRILKGLNNKLIIPFSKIIFKFSKIKSNKIVIDNFGGKGFGDNPKYITQALLDSGEDFDIVWLVNNLNEEMPTGVRKVKYNTISSIKELSTAKIWIDNIKNSVKPKKKTEQFYLQTWHGGLGLKAVERQVEMSLSNKYVQAAKKDANQTDLMISDGKWTTDIFSKWFWYNGKILETGFPRNDLLVNKPLVAKKRVYSYFNLDQNKHIILYAPTFRGNTNQVNPYSYNFKKIINALSEKYNSDFVVLIRLHPNVVDNESKNYDFNKNYLFDAGKYSDMQELLVAANVLITDFSSCMFDGMLAGNRVFLLARDYDSYIKSERNLLFDISNLPFSLSYNEDDLVDKIRKFDDIYYKRSVKRFCRNVGLHEDGNSSERIAVMLEKLVLKGK